MNFAHTLRGLAALLTAGALSAAHASPVLMPTDTGTLTLDSSQFAGSILSGPSGEYACFTGATVSACNANTLQLGVLGADLSHGVVLGLDGSVTLSLPALGPTLYLWEAGTGANDVASPRIAVHTAAGWSAEHTFAANHAQAVLNDTQPSGYGTNFGVFDATDFGLGKDALIDAVRISSCCGTTAHVDVLAVATAAVPEPSSMLLALPGVALLGLGRRRWGRSAPTTTHMA